MKPKLLAALFGILTATAQSQPYCWWTPSVLYTSGQPGYTPGFWAFAYQTTSSAVVQVGYNYFGVTNQAITHTWYFTKTGQRVDIDPGTLRGGSNIVASLSVSACGTSVKSIHARITGVMNFSGYNEAHMTVQEVD